MIKVLESKDLKYIKPINIKMLERYETFIFDRLYNHFEFYVEKN